VADVIFPVVGVGAGEVVGIIGFVEAGKIKQIILVIVHLHQI
jgi:hypothetical protein